MSSRERSLVMFLAVYGVALYALGYFTAARTPVGTREDVGAAQSAIRELRLALDARGDTLEALRAANAVAVEEERLAEEQVAAADSGLARELPASQERADSIAREIRARVDSTVALLVADLEAEHDLQMARVMERLDAERRLSVSRLRRVQILEAANAELERTVEVQAEIIAEQERLDEIRVDQIRSAEAQRNGAVLLGLAGVACALLCGG